MTERYRQRIYGSYVTARHEELAPRTLAGMRPRLPYLRRLIRQHFPPDREASILDVGCGHGAIVHVARQEGYRVIRGVDASPQQVEAARRLGIGGVEEGDLLETLAATPTGSLDVLVAFDVVEHFTRDELIGLVDEARRVLRPGGRWIIHTCNGDSPFVGASLYGDFTHELAFTRSSINQLLRTSGFVSVSCYEDRPAVHGARSAARWLLWEVARSMLRLSWMAETGDTGRDALFTRNFLVVAVASGPTGQGPTV